ncbi:unnamed protein product, partial [Discosporangium mesarthrocarpum]
ETQGGGDWESGEKWGCGPGWGHPSVLKGITKPPSTTYANAPAAAKGRKRGNCWEGGGVGGAGSQVVSPSPDPDPDPNHNPGCHVRWDEVAEGPRRESVPQGCCAEPHRSSLSLATERETPNPNPNPNRGPNPGPHWWERIGAKGGRSSGPDVSALTPSCSVVGVGWDSVAEEEEDGGEEEGTGGAVDRDDGGGCAPLLAGQVQMKGAEGIVLPEGWESLPWAGERYSRDSGGGDKEVEEEVAEHNMSR